MATAVILAGGESRRMGRDKLVLPINGETLLVSAVKRFSAEFGDVFLSLADADKYPDVAVRRVVDIFPGAGPLSGLHAALSSAPGEGVFLVAADLPFSSPKAALRMIELCGAGEACVIMLPNGNLEPLFAYYKKALLPLCEEAIRSGDYRMSHIIQGADTRFVSPQDFGELWDERMILNINFPYDYKKLVGE